MRKIWCLNSQRHSLARILFLRRNHWTFYTTLIIVLSKFPSFYGTFICSRLHILVKYIFFDFFLLLTWLKIIIFRFCFFHDFFLKFHSLLEIFHSCSIKVLYFYIFYSYRYSIFSDLCFAICFSFFIPFIVFLSSIPLQSSVSGCLLAYCKKKDTVDYIFYFHKENT